MEVKLKIALPRAELREACQGFGKIINGKTALPVLGCVRFSAGKNGVVAQATDIDQVVEYRFDGAKLDIEGECIVPYTTMRDLAKGNNNEFIEVEAANPLEVSVTNHVGGHAVARSVTGVALEDWPNDKQADIPTKPAAGFLETYRRLMPFSSRDETRHIINSVYVDVGKGSTPISMIATDGRRLSSWNSMALPIKQSVALPVSKFLSWSRLPANSVEIGSRCDSNVTWFGMQAGPFTYCTKTIEGTYPNYKQVIPAERGEHLIGFTDEDVDLLRQVLPTLPGEEDITLVGQDGEVSLYGRGPDDAQWAKLTLESTTYTGGRAFFGVNRAYLLDALAAGFREFAITDELSPLLSRDRNGGTHVLMPVRTEDPELRQERSEEALRPSVAIKEPLKDKAPVGPKVNVVQEPIKSKKQGKNNVMKQNEQKNDVAAMDRVLTACDAAKTKVREISAALSELGSAIREAARDQKMQGKEIESARSALAKLQSISL